MSSSKKIVKPQTLKGFCDTLPGEMIARNRVLEKIRAVYERYGFSPIDTPVLEYMATLMGTGGEEISKEIFRLESPEHEPIGMRFDLTVPLARVLAQYLDTLKLPFRRYHVGPVFRADKPGPGRFRQFTQFDIDAAGSDSPVVDAEIVAAMCEVMRELGLQSRTKKGDGKGDYLVKINSRKLMDALLSACGIDEDEKRKSVLRVIDKLSKVGLDNIAKELADGRIDESGDPIRGVGLSKAVIDKTLGFIAITSETRKGTLETIQRLLPNSEWANQAMQEMNTLVESLACLQVGEDEAIVSPSLARGLDYYTGPVFEAILPGAPQVGSFMGGGRYDQLVDRFLDTPIPATGASFGVERLLAGLNAIGLNQGSHTVTQALVVGMKGIPASELLKVATDLRNQRIPTEIYWSTKSASVSEQLAYANEKGIPTAILLGSDEIAAGTVSIKDLLQGKKGREGIADSENYRKAGKTGQRTVPRSEMAGVIREILGSIGQ